jgi:hypothetical protein
VARAEIDQPVAITVRAQDVRGNHVHAPDPDRPSVLLFLGREQSQDERLLKTIKESIVAPERATVIAIICGADAKIAPAPDLPWPTVLDPEGKLAGELQIHGWPTGIVLQSDGVQVVRIGGAPESFALKLSPYIDLAAKKLDQAALEQQLNRRTLVGDGPDRTPMRNLRRAEQMLADGRPQEAETLLVEALKVQPDSVALRVALVRALVALKRGHEATDVLSRLSPDELPPGHHDLLRAAALTAMSRWAEAYVVVTEAMTKSPTDLPEAHFILGTIHEHNGEWQKAAKEYRAASSAK